MFIVDLSVENWVGNKDEGNYSGDRSRLGCRNPVSQRIDSNFIWRSARNRVSCFNLNAYNEGCIIENPTWQQTEAAIDELDGKTRTLVTLGIDEDTYMSIGGGEGGKYIVTVTFDNIEFYNLVDRARSSATEKQVVGGQLGTYPATICVSLQTALLAAKTFAESGKLEGTIA